MKIVILCGGQGTRLREETEYRPKPMVEIGGRPILWHIMKTYAQYGFREFVLCLGYRGNMIKDYFLNYEAMNNDFTIHLGQKQHITYHNSHAEQDYSVTLADTGQDAMTGSRLKQVERYLDGNTFMLTYGDGVADINVQAALAYHQAHGRLATMTTVRPPSRYGNVRIDAGGLISEFAEKPRSEAWVNAGYFIFNPGIFDYLNNDLDLVLEREPLERLSRDGQLMAYRHDGFFYAMDTYREYIYLNDLWSSGRAPWKIW